MNNIIYFEIIIALVVVAIQFTFFLITYFNRIRKLANFFPKEKLDKTFIVSSDDSGNSVKTINAENEVFSDAFVHLLESINHYFQKNTGTMDFSIIESKVERSVDTMESAILSKVSLPLYIGLMGTFLGIIVGLFQIAFNGGVIDKNIDSFIGGVVIAMIASFFGLLLTVINNSKNYKKARGICSYRKGHFYDFLQEELLPYLSGNLADTLQRLQTNINSFNDKFEENINKFDKVFSKNIEPLGESVNSLSNSLESIVKNTKTQKELLTELNKLPIEKIVKDNVEVFQLFEKLSPTFIDYIDKQKEMSVSIKETSKSVCEISKLLDRVKSFEESIKSLGERINTSKFLSNEVLTRVDKNLTLLDKQFELLKNHEIAASEKIEDFFGKQYKKIEELTENIKQEVEDAFKVNIENNPFQKLLVLDSLETQLKEMNGKLSVANEINSRKTNTISSPGSRQKKASRGPKNKTMLSRFLSLINRNHGHKKQ